MLAHQPICVQNAVQNAAASLAVPLSASLLGCLAVLALIAIAFLLLARRRRHRRAAAAADQKAAALPVTVNARGQSQVQPSFPIALLAAFPLPSPGLLRKSDNSSALTMLHARQLAVGAHPQLLGTQSVNAW